MELYTLYFKCFMAVLIGLGIHTGLKYQSTLKLHKVAEEKYSFMDFIRKGKISHAVNLLCCFFWMLILHDVIMIYPKIELFITLLSGCVGYANSSLVIRVFGIGQKVVMDKLGTLADQKKGNKV